MQVITVPAMQKWVVPVEDSQEVPVGNVTNNVVMWALAVSYTHLDVYKRQI